MRGFFVCKGSAIAEPFERIRKLLGRAGLVRINHLLDHLAAYRTCFTGSQIAVIAVLEIYAYFVCSLNLESFKCVSALFGCNTLHDTFSFKNIFD